MKQPDRSNDSSWCKLGAQCRGFDGRCRRWPHCRPGKHSQSVPKKNFEWSKFSCMARQRQLRPVGRGRWQTPTWTSFRSQRRDASSRGRRIRNRYHHQMSGRSRNPGDQYIDQPIFGCGQGPGRQSPYQWCSDHGRSCWRHPPYQ